MVKKGISPGKYIIRISFAFVLASSLALCSHKTVLSNESSRLSNPKGIQVKEDVLKGIHLLYDERFDDAEDLFRRISARIPDRPDAYFYLAMVVWSRISCGFQSPETVQEFKERIDHTIRVAGKRISSGVPDSYDYFFLGGALGFKGRFELMRGKYLSSFFLASDAIDAFHTSLEMAPDNMDVLLGLGTFDYYTARLSGVLKFLTYLLVHKGNKEEGLRKLNIAAKESLYSATEAKSVLLHIYLFLEENFLKALPLAEDLAAGYDRSLRHKVLKGVCYIRLGRDLQYRELVNDLRHRGKIGSSYERASSWNRRALYLDAVYDLFHARYREARSKMRTILNQADPERDPEMIAWPLLKIGMSYDLEGDRKEATRHYRRVLNMKNGSGAQFLAKKYKGTPAKEGDPFIGY